MCTLLLAARRMATGVFLLLLTSGTLPAIGDEFPLSEPIPIAGFGLDLFDAATADSDGDGHQDVAAVEEDRFTLFANSISAADMDNDGDIDLGTMKAAFFSTPLQLQWNADADLNGDNAVNFTDLGTMKSLFFGPPGPSGLPNACD